MNPHEPLVSTYSIVAIDRDAGLMGVAVQSHFFAVGALVPWARAGVGVVATQSVVNPGIGPRGLDLLAGGESPAAAVDRLVTEDSAPEVRQFALLAADGAVATHTGHRCIAAAGHVHGDGFSVQANMMDRPGVPEAMARAWEESSGALPDRLVAALQAAEESGGDIRGRQSAALVIVSVTPGGGPLAERPVDLRVDDHPEPVAELSRLLKLHGAYRAVDAGDEAMARGETAVARTFYNEARAAAPDREELVFWAAVSAAAESPEDARNTLSSLGPIPGSRWWRLAVRLPDTGLFACDSEAWDRFLAPVPGCVYHIDDGTGADPLRPASLESEGFVHCSFAHQVPAVLRRHYPGLPDPVVIEIAVGGLDVPLHVEDSYGIGEAFPHIYGPVTPSAVRRRGPVSEIVPGLVLN